MLYMSSTSTATGQLTLTVFLSLDTDPDIAQVQVQNRVNLALPQLPEAVTQLGVSVQKKSSSIMMLVASSAKDGRYSAEYVANYANVYVLDALKRVPGAGQAQIMGVPDQAMRIWMNPDKMASLSITTSDIQNAVAAQNALFGAGQIGQQPNDGPVQLTFPVVTQRPVHRPAAVREHHPAREPGRQRDRAPGRRGARRGRAAPVHRRHPAQQRSRPPSSPFTSRPAPNGLVVSQGGAQDAREMKAASRTGIEYAIALDTNDFVRLSIEEVIHTLIEAIVLVVLVVYLFLQSFRTTLICAVAIVVALVSTFARNARARASRSTCSRCSAWCSRSAWWSTTRSWWSRTSSASWRKEHLSAQGGDHQERWARSAPRWWRWCW